MVGIMMIDLSAAFDMVDHDLLLSKLKLLGLERSALNWFNSYLRGRSQSVMVDGCLSSAVTLECGVNIGTAVIYSIYE